MLTVNRFGSGNLLTIHDLIGGPEAAIFCTSTACMSVTTDFMSWIEEDGQHIDYMVYEAKDASIIILLTCQVTDLAILNDLKTAGRLHKENPDARIIIGGCLAQRFDIALPEWTERLDVVRAEYRDIMPITDEDNFVRWEKPFWIPEQKWDEHGGSNLNPGRLFRHMYPLKIGAGCHGNCKYCTIKDTRGETYEADAYLQVGEFLAHDEDIVLVSDSPSAKQIKDWCHLAIRYNKAVSFRNVEPQIANCCETELKDLAFQGLLKIFHCPIQSNDPKLLQKMGRSAAETDQYIYWSQELRRLGVLVATNIIIDYWVDGRLYHNYDPDFMSANFDYWTWNPHFDGIWNRETAELRWKRYIGE